MTVMVVHEGESAFLSVTLFSVEGETELDIAGGDVQEVSWKRVVKGTNEEVVASTVISPNPTTNPFTLEQTPSHNTRKDSTWKYEIHRVEITYSYTYNAASGKTGVFSQEILLMPVGWQPYAPLHERSRFLARVTAGDRTKDMLQTEDILECEEWADQRIESRLGKSLKDTTKGIPPLIRLIADMLGSAQARHFLHVAQDSAVSKYAEKLEDRAEKVLDELIAHKAGIQYLDGTWDDDYPAPGSHSAVTALGYKKGLSMDHRRTFHEMEEFTPSTEDDERTGYDEEDRGTRKTEW